MPAGSDEENHLDFSYADIMIDSFIRQKKINMSFFDKELVQPSSLDLPIGDSVFILDTETDGLFRPTRDKTVYRTLLELPKRQRQRVDISNGFEAKKDYTYLLPLEAKITLAEREYVKSSPKSSLGRLFLDTRLVTDYHDCFDEILGRFRPNKELQLWALLQPLAFNVILYPGISLNQLRIFSGPNAKLTPLELEKKIKGGDETNGEDGEAFLYLLDQNGKKYEAEHIITDGLQTHLNLTGRYTDGIVGLRARNNPAPIDLSEEKKYDAEDFFEPLKSRDGRLIKKKGDCCLFSSYELVRIPDDLNAELRDHSHVGLHGELHFAGFFDNGFSGDAVYEIRSNEVSDIILFDGMPITLLDFYRAPGCAKPYKDKIGTHYDGQVGPKPSKHFKQFDYKFAAKEYKTLDRLVLVQDAKILRRINQEGFHYLTPETLTELTKCIDDGFFISKYDVEGDELVLQPIPYVLLFGPQDTIFTFQRADELDDFGEVRLFGKHSIGVGGHITKKDSPDYVKKNMYREVHEEVELYDDLGFNVVGTIMAYDKPVDSFHFGIVVVGHTNQDVRPKERSIKSGGMLSIDELVDKVKLFEKIKDPEKEYETWTKVLVPYLHELKKL